ncbi:hypothetical protein ES703_88758 [subsurface metagenome]
MDTALPHCTTIIEAKTMKLNIGERFALLGVLPQQGNAITLRIIRELQSRLSFTEEELKHYNIQNHTNPDGSARVTWNPELSEEETDIPIGEAATGVIKGELTRLNAQNQLHVTMLPLYEKFVEDIK